MWVWNNVTFLFILYALLILCLLVLSMKGIVLKLPMSTIHIPVFLSPFQMFLDFITTQFLVFRCYCLHFHILWLNVNFFLREYQRFYFFSSPMVLYLSCMLVTLPYYPPYALFVTYVGLNISPLCLVCNLHGAYYWPLMPCLWPM